MKQTNFMNRAVCWAIAIALAMLPTLAQETVTVTCQWEYGNLSENYDYVYPMIGFSLDNKCRNTPSQGQQQNIFQLSPGLYDFITVHLGEKSTDVDYFVDYLCVVKENVLINGDTTLTFDLTDATNQLKVALCAPDGEEFSIENCALMGPLCHLIRKADGGVLVIEGGSYAFRPYITPNFYLNDISDRFLLSQCRIYSSDDWIPEQYTYILGFVTDDITKPWVNDPKNYVYAESTFESSKISQEEEINGGGSRVNLFYNQHFIVGRGLGYICDKKNTYGVYFDLPAIDEENPGAYFLIQPIFSDYLEDFGHGSYEAHCIDAPYMTIHDGEPMYMNLGAGCSAAFFNTELAGGQLPFFAGKHPFYFTPSQMKQNFGSNTPIVVYDNSCLGDEGSISVIQMGRFGEKRKVDEDFSEMILKKNGEQIWSGSPYSYEQVEFYYQEPFGLIEQEYINQNVIVDGLDGHNLTTVQYDENRSDATPPSLTMLWFKESNDDITDRFTTASDGIFELSAGDFVPHFAEDALFYNKVLWHSCQPLSGVEVAYSPYQEDAWNELEVEEIPENFCSPGYGYFYRGSLAGVTGEALKGWFDLKVKLTDAAGNWQEQIVSPAFRIDDLAYTSVASIGSDNAHEVARYSIDGKRVDANHRGVTIVKMSDGTARKILVK